MGMDIGVGSGKGKKRGRARPEMNVTPLVDVVLVLLIIFMVVTPLLAKQFWVHLPEKPDDKVATPPPDANDKQVVVSVSRDGKIRINRDEVSDAAFSEKLRRVLAARGDRKVFFDADDDAPFGRATQVMDLARAGGASTVAVATEKLAGL